MISVLHNDFPPPPFISDFPMKKSLVSRRKFVTGIGLTAGAVALGPTLSNFVSSSSNQERGLLGAWSKPTNRTVFMEPVKTLNRQAGSHRLPLLQRPF